MTIKALRKVVYRKIEAVYGTDPVPVVATDAVLAHNFSCTPIELQYAKRNPVLPFFGNQGQIKAGDFMRMEYDIEIAGAGGVATVPGFGVDLRACALSETNTPVTGPTTYAPISSGEESVTHYFNWDGLQHKMLGARSTLSLKFSKGGVPMMHFACIGLYGGITDAALPVPTLTAFQRPLAVTKANTTFSLHGYAAPLADLTIDYGVDNQYDNKPNQEVVRFLGRNVTGSVTIEVPTIAAKDYFSIIRAETAGALALVHGIAAGNKFQVDAANVQLTSPRYSETEGVGMLQMGMEIKPSAAGNDEITLKTQ